MRKLLFHTGWIIPALYLVAVPPVMRLLSAGEPCHSVNIAIKDSLEIRFVSHSQVFDRMHEGTERILGLPVSRVQTAHLEQMIYELPAVKNVEAYTTTNGVVHLEVEQRKPLARLIYENGSHLYIDREGALIPAREDYTSRVLVVNGKLGEPPAVVRNDEAEEQDPLLKDLLTLVKYIHSDPLWKAQIEQLYVNSKGEYELIPRLGAHHILLGPAEGYEEKFRNLMALYRQAMPRLGWNTYETINLKYQGQIICTKR